MPGPSTRRVGRTSVQSSVLARTTRSISRTSAKGLAKMRGRIIFTNGLASGSSLMNAPAADTQISRCTPCFTMAWVTADAAAPSKPGVFAPRGPRADSTASALATTSATAAGSVASPPVTVTPGRPGTASGRRASTCTG